MKRLKIAIHCKATTTTTTVRITMTIKARAKAMCNVVSQWVGWCTRICTSIYIIYVCMRIAKVWKINYKKSNLGKTEICFVENNIIQYL